MRKSLLASIAVLLMGLTPATAATSRPDKSAMTPFKVQPRQTQKSSSDTNSTYFLDLRTEAEKELLNRKGIQVFNSFEKISTQESNLLENDSPIKEGEERHALTVNLIYDINSGTMPQYPSRAYSKDTQGKCFYNSYPMFPFTETLDWNLPEGSYDIEVIMRTNQGDLIVLTASDVNVSEDTEITLDVADATEEIKWNALMPDGTMPVGEIFVYDPETGLPSDVEQGNVIGIMNDVTIFNKSHDMSSSFVTNQLTSKKNGELYHTGLYNIKMIPNSDYLFYYEKKAVGPEGGYVISLSSDALQSKEVTNDINHYKTLIPEYAYTPYQPEPDTSIEDRPLEFDKNKAFLLGYITLQNGAQTSRSFFGNLNTNLNVKKEIHICQDPTLAETHQIIVTPSLMEDWDASKYNSVGLPVDTELESPMVTGINNTVISIRNDYWRNPDKPYPLISDYTNPLLSFDVTKPHVWNYGCPVLVFSTYYKWNAGFNQAYIGRLGENRSIDFKSTEARVSVNDAAPSEEILQNLQWGQLPEEGKIDFEYTDTNVAIDDIPGKNVTRIGFDMSRSDWQPPTLQLVRFVDNEDNFIDRFASGDKGVIEFYGGDFDLIYLKEESYGWYTEEPATEVKVEYAPYGSDAFLPLEVENIPERDFMPGFGTYYRGSLASVDRKSENGWFDVRITLTDEAGNYQEQTLSPAFKIDENLGVEETAYPEIIVTVAKGNITVYGCENPEMEIYSTDGLLLNRVTSDSCDASQLNHGVYLVTIKDGNKMAVRKIRI